MINFYSKKFPDKQDIVIVKITEVSKDKGLSAVSNEYPGLSIYVLPTEIARKRANINKMFSQDKLYPVLVMDVNKNKKNVDASYVKVPAKEHAERIERYQILQKIHRLGQHVATKYQHYYSVSPEEAIKIVFGKLLWPILDNYNNFAETTLKEIVEGYNSILINPKTLFTSNEHISSEFVSHYAVELAKQISISEVKMVCEIQVVVHERDAMTRLKKILKPSIDKVLIDSIASPRYSISVVASEKNIAKELIMQAIEKIKQNCVEFGGTFIDHSEPTIQKEKQFHVSF